VGTRCAQRLNGPTHHPEMARGGLSAEFVIKPGASASSPRRSSPTVSQRVGSTFLSLRPKGRDSLTHRVEEAVAADAFGEATSNESLTQMCPRPGHRDLDVFSLELVERLAERPRATVNHQPELVLLVGLKLQKVIPAVQRCELHRALASPDQLQPGIAQFNGVQIMRLGNNSPPL